MNEDKSHRPVLIKLDGSTPQAEAFPPPRRAGPTAPLSARRTPGRGTPSTPGSVGRHSRDSTESPRSIPLLPSLPAQPLQQTRLSPEVTPRCEA
jgi:hypothetical protein